MRTSASESDWTPEEVKGLRLNPIYTGIGCFMPGSVTDEEWVRGAVRSIKEDGPEQFLVNILHLLRESFAVSDEDSEPEQGVHS